MWRSIRHTVLGWLLRANVLTVVVRPRSPVRSEHLLQLKRKVLHLCRLLPVETAAQELCRIIPLVPSDLGVPLAQWAADTVVKSREALLTVARALNGWGKFDQAEAMLWRGIRLYEDDKNIWDTALHCTLRHVLYSASYVEWQRARHRLSYLLEAVPASLREEPPISSYFVFDSEQGADLLDKQLFVMWLWGSQKMEKAREALSLFWNELPENLLLPDGVVGWVGWSMLGLGLFDLLEQSVVIQKVYPTWTQVASWYRGQPLATPSGIARWDALLMLSKWAQDLLRRKRPSPIHMWQTLLASNTPNEQLVSAAMLAATLGLKRDTLRQRVEHWLSTSPGNLFLPYLHLLCVSAARLRWKPLTQQLWGRISLFGVDYARRADLHRYIQTDISAAQ